MYSEAKQEMSFEVRLGLGGGAGSVLEAVGGGHRKKKGKEWIVLGRRGGPPHPRKLYQLPKLRREWEVDFPS